MGVDLPSVAFGCGVKIDREFDGRRNNMAACLKNLMAIVVFFAAMLSFGRSWAAEWKDTRIFGPFVCRADFDLEDNVSVLSDLGDLQDELVETLQIAAPKEAIQVYLFHDEGTYRRYLKQLYPDMPFRRAFFIQERGRQRIFAFDSSQFEADLRHEGTHALLHASLATVPLWLDEGLAGYFEVLPEKRLNKAPHFSATLWNARFGIAPDLTALEKMDDAAAMGKNDYRDSWAWVHFLLNGPAEAKNDLRAYLQDLNQPKTPVSLSNRLNRRYSSPETEFKDFFKRAGKK
jgi:hypothetical protein